MIEAQGYERTVSKEVAKRIRLERQIIRAIVRSARAKGYVISINDGGEWCLRHSANEHKIMSAIMGTDADTLAISRRNDEGKFSRVGNVYLVYGNDGWDVVCDHTDTPEMRELLAKADEISNKAQR